MLIVSGLVLIGFYLSRKISLTAIDNLMEEIERREIAEENLKKANEELEDKVKERTAELSKTVKILEENIAKRKKMEEKLYIMSLTDELTGVYNRRGFFTIAENRLKIAKRQKSELLLLYADLDNLKEINDKFGHEEGDNLLKDTVNILKSIYRECDIIARIGGDEFVVFPVGTNKSHIEIITSRLQKTIEDINAKRDQSYKLSLSVGISAYDPETVTSIDGLLAEADRLMYKHKIRKKGQT
jgi:diguanylate cyclase (GGDEF)-like protein